MCGKAFSRSDHLGLHLIKHKEMENLPSASFNIASGAETIADNGLYSVEELEPTRVATVAVTTVIAEP